MRRVLVIGSGGAGKTTLSRRLHEITGLPLIHLDAEYWQPGWVEMPKDQWREKVERLVERDSWIMDGNFGGTMDARFELSDTVIFLDTHRFICIYRALKRWVRYRGRSRPDMAPGCTESMDVDFLRWIWNYRKTSGKRVEAYLKRHEDSTRIVRLRSKRETEQFLSLLEEQNSQAAG